MNLPKCLTGKVDMTKGNFCLDHKYCHECKLLDKCAMIFIQYTQKQEEEPLF